MNTISSIFSESHGKKRAIAYYRHSAEDKQENSVLIQREHVHEFAKRHDIEIIHEEADEGKTGLLADRAGFIALFKNWIENKDAPPFDYVLVYDVSRWGRFQDQNQPAHYEYVCTLHGKKVVFVEDGFPHEGQQLIGSLQTAMKRFMAAEYSRQLSQKVFYGCIKVSEQGFSAGGMACYGMARELLDVNKQPIRFLKKGEHKQIANERVRFVPLNDDTTNVVRDIFSMFVTENLALSQIVSALNDRGIPSACGGLWNRDKIVRILMNETYTGARIYNKTWNRLRQGKRHNPRKEWVIRRNTFPPIVQRDLFEKAQEKLWFTLGKWKEGRQAIKIMRMHILKGLQKFLMKKGMSEDKTFFLCRDFPFVCSISVQVSPSKKEWCFLLPEEMRTFEFVFGIGVLSKKSNPIDQFFLIPTKDFGVGGVCIFTNEDEIFPQYEMKLEEFEQKILATIH